MLLAPAVKVPQKITFFDLRLLQDQPMGLAASLRSEEVTLC